MSGTIVADAGPLHYLILIDCAELLPSLFSQILVPETVQNELFQAATPHKVKTWMALPKSWLQVQPVKDALLIRGLHRGENEAIQLALRKWAAGVLMDDLDARKAARSLGLNVIGTLGVIERAAEKNLILLPEVIEKLRQTNFFISPKLLEAALRRDKLRRDKE